MSWPTAGCSTRPELPALGPHGVLSVRRRLRVPRPAAGRDGAGPRRTGLTREHLLRAPAAVPRRRRAALVASAHRARRAHAFLRRLPLAALRDLPLRHERGDTGVLDEKIPFLKPGRSNPTRKRTTICPSARKRIGHALRTLRARHRTRPAFGEHGLPLIGSGDWNDGMNRVGARGPRRKRVAGVLPLRRAERLPNWPRARRRRSPSAAPGRRGSCSRTSSSTAGTANGIAAPTSTTANPWAPTNEECQIDALPQSWSVISGAGDPARAPGHGRVDQRLVRRDAG
jgi:cyclic beta-1,2-glucan synthetase